MHIGILNANTDNSEFAKHQPTEAEKWQNLLGQKRPKWKFTNFQISDGDFPKDLADFDGWIVTASPASVHDDAPWINNLFDLIVELEHNQTKLLGAGFGHQAIAKALGGKVAKNPNGWNLGSTEIEACARPRWMEAKRFWQYSAHEEQVTSAPQNAQVVLRSKNCPIAGLAIEQHVFSTQTHAEYTHDFIKALVDEFAKDSPKELIENASASLPLSADNGLFSDIIIRFFELK
jgi:GMP synthase-like glutamine amidotransferase